MTNDLSGLRRSLTKYLDDPEKIKQVAEKSGINLEEINWQNPSALIWNYVITECQKVKTLTLLQENIRSLEPDKENHIELNRELKFYEEIEKKLEGLPLDYQKMGMLDTINCSRKMESNDFWKFDENKSNDLRLLTGIIAGHFAENPGSLAERLIMEYVSAMEAEDQAVFYRRDGTTRRIQPLKIAVNTRVALHHAVDQYLESILDGHKLKNYTVIAHVVEVDVESSPNILDIIFDLVHRKLKAFCENQGVLNLLLMVYPYPKAFDAASLNQHLSAKVKEFQDVKYYRITSGVTMQEITYWFKSNGLENMADIPDYMEPFIESWLDKEMKSVFTKKEVLPMNIMESIQDHLFKYVMQEPAENNAQENEK